MALRYLYLKVDLEPGILNVCKNTCMIWTNWTHIQIFHNFSHWETEKWMICNYSSQCLFPLARWRLTGERFAQSLLALGQWSGRADHQLTSKFQISINKKSEGLNKDSLASSREPNRGKPCDHWVQTRRRFPQIHSWLGSTFHLCEVLQNKYDEFFWPPIGQ